jgi:hypothetical protein
LDVRPTLSSTYPSSALLRLHGRGSDRRHSYPVAYAGSCPVHQAVKSIANTIWQSAVCRDSVRNMMHDQVLLKIPSSMECGQARISSANFAYRRAMIAVQNIQHPNILSLPLADLKLSSAANYSP